MTISEVRSTWFGVRNSMVSVVFSDTVRAPASKAVKMMVIISAHPCADMGTLPESSATASRAALRTRASLVGQRLPLPCTPRSPLCGDMYIISRCVSSQQRTSESSPHFESPIWTGGGPVSFVLPLPCPPAPTSPGKGLPGGLPQGLCGRP